VLDCVLGDAAAVKAFAKASTNIAAAREVLGDPQYRREVP
jgi:hypothetical protein